MVTESRCADGTEPDVLPPGAGRRIDIPEMPKVSTVKVAGATSGGRVSVHEEWHGPNDPGVPCHFHHHLDEIFCVLEGDMRFFIGDSGHVVVPGSVVYVPRGTAHSWRPVGMEPVRQLVVFIAGGSKGTWTKCKGCSEPSNH
jgi:mannose-6-phosphate isomerase-like protein (cupin superfamily)